MNHWFIADTHFGHANIIKYSKRPFKNLKEMDETLIKNWNDHVRPNDQVYHLGDFAFGDNPAKYANRLNGKIHLVLGNHDYKQFGRLAGLFETVQDVKEIKLGRQRIFLSHYAHRTWPGSHKGSWHLFGHTHGTLLPMGKSFDVGVDEQDFKPINLDQVRKRMDVLAPFDDVMEKLRRLEKEMSDHQREYAEKLKRK